MASDNQHFCLRWNNHQSTLISVFDTLLESGTLVDCTLAAEGQYMKAHKVVLCACSPYLEVLLSQHYEKHPIVILKDIKFQELKSMMDYMYRGEVNISQDQLSTFLKAAESLQIKGLTDGGGNEDGAASNAPSKAPIAAPVRKPVSVHQPTSRSSAGPQGLTIERRPDSPHMSSRADSASPTPKRRRRNQRRPSTSDDPDSHVDTSNSCDVPPLQSGALSGVGVPNIPATITKGGAPLDDGDHETENSGINNHDASAADGVAGPKIEPTGGDLIEPKTEYMDDMNNEDSIEDLTLDDDDDMDNSVDMSRAGPSHDNSNQSYGQWPMTGNQGDEVFMAAQDAVGAHRDTQDDDQNFACDVEHQLFEDTIETTNLTESENYEESETLPVHGDQRVWVKRVEELFTDEIKKEIPDIEIHTIVDIKDEIKVEDEEVEEEEEEEEEEFEASEYKEGSESVPDSSEPPALIQIPLPKVAIPKIHSAISLKKVTRKLRRRQNRTILPMDAHMAPANTSHMGQVPLQTSYPTPHQIIMPSSQMPGIAYQIILGDHNKNSTNPVQYTMIQPQPMFIQQTPTSVSSASPVVMNQPSMVINQPFHMNQSPIQSSTKVPHIASKKNISSSRKARCLFCYKLFHNLDVHFKECWLNPDSSCYKFRKIAPSTQ